MCKIIIFLVCFLIYVIQFSELKTISEDVKFAYFRDFIDDIKSQMDNNAKPCQDFKQFACGNLRKQQEKQSQLMDYVTKNLTNLTEKEKSIKVLYNLLRKDLNYDSFAFFNEVNFLKKFKQWPVGDIVITDEDIMRLLVEISYLGTFNSQKQMFLQLRTYIDGNISNKMFLIECEKNFSVNGALDGIAEVMESFGAKKDIAASAISDITQFLNEVEIILNSNELVDKEISSNKTDFETIKNTFKNFDWTSFFKIYTENLDLDQNHFANKPFQIDDINKVTKLFNLIARTNKKTFANTLIWLYIKPVKWTEIMAVPHFFFPASESILFEDLYRDYFTQYDRNNEIEIIELFEKSVAASQGTILNFHSELIKTYFQNRRELLTGSTIVSDLINDLKKFHLNEDAFYMNFLKLQKIGLRTLIKYELNYLKSTLKFAQASHIDLDAHNKPILYYFIHDFILFSKQLYGDIEFLGSADKTNECVLDDKDEISTVNINYPVFTITNAYESYVRWLKFNDGDLMTRMNKYLEEVGLTQKQAFWLAMEQNLCTEVEYFSKVLEKILKKLRAFSQDFDCVHSCPSER